MDSNGQRENDREFFIDRKAHQFGVNLESSEYDLIGKNVDFENGDEDVDILFIKFGESPQVQIKNYYLESVPNEFELNDSRYESWRSLLPETENWGIDPRQIRASRDSIDEDLEPADWDFCYRSLDEYQFELFSENFLGYEVDYWDDRKWVSWEQEYF